MTEVNEEVLQHATGAAAVKLEVLKRKTLVFTTRGSYSWCQTAALLSNINLYEFTTIILDNELAFEGIGTVLTRELLQSIGQRLATISNWVKEGHTLIIVPRNLNFTLKNNIKLKIDLDGTYGDDIKYDLNKGDNFSLVDYSYATGARIEYCGPPTLEEFFRPWTSRLSYQTFISALCLKPLLRVIRGSRGSAQLVGGIVKHEAGRVIFLPPTNAAATSQVHMEYLCDLARLPEHLQETLSKLPEWTANFQTSDEAQARDNVDALRTQISGLESAIRGEEDKISEAGRLKALFASSGDVFVTAVRDALTELGFGVIDGPHPRADLIAFDNTHGLLVVEAKGLDGCVREANLRQAERWVADVKYACAASQEELHSDADMRGYADKFRALGISLPAEQDVKVKGAMVIGTFRKLPLDKRVEPDFPDPVTRVVSRSEVCALTGLQLLLMILQVRKDPTLKSKFIEWLCTSNGQLSLEVTWNDLLVTPHGS